MNTFSTKFDVANNSSHTKTGNEGSGSLEIKEVAYFVRSMTTGREKTFINLNEWSDRMGPLISKWDLDGNGTMELHEICTMMLCDENFDMTMPAEARSQLLQLMNVEEPQMINGELKKAHQDKSLQRSHHTTIPSTSPPSS